MSREHLNPKSPKATKQLQAQGYAPDLFSEHARAAQLGLRVVEILLLRHAHVDCTRWLSEDAYRALLNIRTAAHDLGFLAPRETEAGRGALAPDPSLSELTPDEVCRRVASGYYTASKSAKAAALSALRRDGQVRP